MYTAGIDIGGTNIKFGIFDSEMNCVHTALAKSVRGDSAALARQIRYLMDRSPVKPDIIGAGALVTSKTESPAGSLVLGIPAQVTKKPTTALPFWAAPA